MDHAGILEHLDEYRDGELPPELAAEVARHLEACPDCRAALEERAALAGSLSRLARAEPSEAFVRGVMERLRPAAQPSPAGWVMPSLAAGFAVAAVFVVLGLSGTSGESGAAVSDLLNAGDSEAAETFQVIESAGVLTHDQVLGTLVEEES
jgi:anti-sigma factor RsiW